MIEHDDYAAFATAQSEGWGGAIMTAPKNIIEKSPDDQLSRQKAVLAVGVSYSLIHEEMATGEGMPEPVGSY